MLLRAEAVCEAELSLFNDQDDHVFNGYPHLRVKDHKMYAGRFAPGYDGPFAFYKIRRYDIFGEVTFTRETAPFYKSRMPVRRF